MKNDPLGFLPNSAQVKKLDLTAQAKTAWGEIVQAERWDVKRRYDLGKILNDLKTTDGDHGKWGDTLQATNVPQQRASEMMRAAKLPAPVISQCQSWREVMETVSEAEKKENKASGDVPFGPASTATAGEPSREPGDEKAYEDIAAKIAKALCPRCKRLKGPSCQKCRSMAYRVEHGSETPSKPPANGKHKEDPNNGRVLFEWARYRKSKTEFLACIDSLAKGYGKEFTPERAAFDRLLLQLDTQVKEAYKKWAKQEPPQFS